MSFGFRTEDGWPSCTQDELDFSLIPGTSESVGLQRGQPNAVLKAFMGDLNRYVEAAVDSRGGGQDEGGWTGTNSVPTSNHLGGTAFDYNWRDHPMGPKVPDPAAGWQWSAIVGGPEEPRVRELLDYYTYKGLQLVWWANDWDSPHDSMHFQMGYGTYGDPRVQQFIDECIDPATGLSRFFEHKGQSPNADAGTVLAEAMLGHAGVNYQDMAPLFAGFLQEADCTTAARIAMAAAQLGEESAGLYYMEEIADGSEYEGRDDLGNTQPGDGKRFKGRGPIQLTGRHNYTVFSQWAYDNHRDMCPTPTYFVDNPELVSEFDNGFLAAAYFWMSHNLNSYADNGDVVGATHVINGGEHGLQDRQFRYNTCTQMGDRLLELLNGDDVMSAAAEQMIREIHDEMFKTGPSRAAVADNGDNIETLLGYVYNIDGNVWDQRNMGLAYLIGVPYAVEVVERVASGGPVPDSWAASNDFVASFATDMCKALVEFKPKWQALFGITAKKAPAKRASKK